ncbi:MAG: hypothetical protein NT062_00170 [Proteobacteria bacterium]|nr:hypothetical protein [Pseudomonadota bacterium]
MTDAGSIAARFSCVELRGNVDLKVGGMRDVTEFGVLEALASDAPLADVLALILLGYEERFSGMRASVLLLDADGRTLHHGAAPHLPTGAVDCWGRMGGIVGDGPTPIAAFEPI